MIDTDKANLIYEAIRINTRMWVPIRRIRNVICQFMTDQEFDALMVEMVKLGITYMIPEENQKVLTDTDRDSAVMLAGQPCHLVALMERL